MKRDPWPGLPKKPSCFIKQKKIVPDMTITLADEVDPEDIPLSEVDGDLVRRIRQALVQREAKVQLFKLLKLVQ